MTYKILKTERKKQGLIKSTVDIFGLEKIYVKTKENKINKLNIFNKAFLITFIPLYFFMGAFLFYKADTNIKELTANSKNDILFDIYIGNKTLSVIYLNENITFKMP